MLSICKQYPTDIWLREVRLHFMLEMDSKLTKKNNPNFAKIDGIIAVKKINIACNA